MSQEKEKWPAIGNEKAVKYLKKVIEAGNAAGTYIFIGPSSLGKATLALAFSNELIGGTSAKNNSSTSFNADLHILECEEGKKNISITQVREMIKALSLSSFLNSYKIGIIKEADKLSVEAQNALLKTLEEPRDKVVLILIAENETSLLPTILSRGQKIYFQKVESEIIYDYLIDNYGAKRSLARDLANISLGRPYRAVKFLEDSNAYENYCRKAELLLKSISLGINDRLLNLSQVFSDKSYSQTAISDAREIISIFEGILRDLLLIHFNQPERVQHSFLIEELKKQEQVLENSPVYLLNCFKLTARAKDNLNSSVNPNLTLEQLMANL